VILPRMHLKDMVLLQKKALAKSPKMRQLPVALQPKQLRMERPPLLKVVATPRLIFWRVDVQAPHQHLKVVRLVKLKTT